MTGRRLARTLTLLALATWTPPAAPQAPPPAPVPDRRPVVSPRLDTGDLALRRALADDDIAGNAKRAYLRLRQRGPGARAVLADGLTATDWQERLLSAVLLAQLPSHESDQDLLIRVLIGHLGDNDIRADASLAGHALVLIGTAAEPYLRAVHWHAEPQLADLARRLELTVRSPLKLGSSRAVATRELADLWGDLRWAGRGPARAPEPAPNLPDLAERTRRNLVDLGSDERVGNANQALGALRQRVYWASRRDPETGQLGPVRKYIKPLDERFSFQRRALLAALEDPDRQRRQLAGYLLMRAEEQPTAALLRVALEALEQDEFGSSGTANVANANDAGQWLLQHLDHAAPYLLQALSAPTPSVRIRAAAVLAKGRYQEHSAYVPLLIEHLASNDIHDDATLCGRSLVELGPAALPWLAVEPVDAQQTHYFEAVRRSIALREADPTARIPFSNGGMYGLTRRQRR